MGTLATIAVIGNILLPPLALDHDPAGRVMVYEFPLARIASECRQADVASCASVFDGACIVILPTIGPGGVSLRDRSLLRRHEYGHCNGWTGNHPDARCPMTARGSPICSSPLNWPR